MRSLLIIVTATSAACLLAGAASGQDASAEGKRLFLQCRACHTLKASEPKRTGPTLEGVFGAKIAGRPDYSYSAALKAMQGTWDETTLSRWLEAPAAMAPGNKMLYVGMKDAAQRQTLIDWLKKETAP